VGKIIIKNFIAHNELQICEAQFLSGLWVGKLGFANVLLAVVPFGATN
jgi:hypothetical protein